MNLKEAKRRLQEYDMTFRKIAETGEFRVAYLEDKHESERCAYYTDDLADALNTGVAMRRERQNR